MTVTMMKVMEGRKGAPWIDGMNRWMPPGTPVWHMEVERADGETVHRIVEVSEHPDGLTPEKMESVGWFAPHGAVGPM